MSINARHLESQQIDAGISFDLLMLQMNRYTPTAHVH